MYMHMHIIYACVYLHVCVSIVSKYISGCHVFRSMVSTLASIGIRVTARLPPA